ncbi:unnamed protein product [Peronospora belbahrii]|uniref:Uncharacterized protein n=1 Tax=Peronospora belbahrii TaxID=622444 RepID=A0ABN8D879_9STRA|nr:unnamed protein product [Peronospora belbahrii]
MTDEEWKESGAASDAPLPPPPPPPPPPQGHSEDGMKQKRCSIQMSNSTPKHRNKKKDFREILALFHEPMDTEKAKSVWNSLWQTTLMESQEEYRKRLQQEQHGLKRKKSGEPDHGSMSTRGAGLGSLARHGSLTQDQIKRARQSSATSTDSSESGKVNRLGSRFPKNVTKGSKLLQKFGSRT